MSDIFDHEGDAFEAMIAGQGDYGASNSLGVACHYCRRAGLRWARMGPAGKWRLVDQANRVHTCAQWRVAHFPLKPIEVKHEVDRVRVDSRAAAKHDVQPSSTQQGNIMQATETKKSFDRRAMLRVKLKSLAAEARIIRHEERRYAGTALQPELWLHRTRDVRAEARATHLAYGFIRGRTFGQMECNTKDPVGEQTKERVKTMLRKYGPAGMAEPDYAGK